MTFEFNNPLLYELREDLISKQDLCVISNESKIVLDELPSEFYGVTAVLVGTAQAGASGTITLTSSASATDDRYNNFTITITGGTGAGQSKLITDYVGSTKVATISGTWAITPNNTSVYSVACYNESKIITGLSINSFYVNYLNSIITFNSSEIGRTVLASYQGRGVIQIPAERVYTKVIDGATTQSMQDVADSVGDASTVLSNLNSAIGTGGTTNTTLNLSISNAVSTKNSLDTSESIAELTKSQLDSINSEALVTKTDLTNINNTAIGTIDDLTTLIANNQYSIDSENTRQSNEITRESNEDIRESQENNRENTYNSSLVNFKGVVNLLSDLPSTLNQLGDTYQVINDPTTSNNAMWRYNGTIFEKSYVLDLTFAGGYGANDSQVFTATENQTVFTLTEFPYLIGVNQLMVYITGIKQIIGVNYTETSTNSFTLSSGVVAGTKVEAFRSVPGGAGSLTTQEVENARVSSLGIGYANLKARLDDHDSNKVGVLANLNTSVKTDIVSAINEQLAESATQSIAYVETIGSDTTGTVSRRDKPYATINAALDALPVTGGVVSIGIGVFPPTTYSKFKDNIVLIGTKRPVINSGRTGLEKGTIIQGPLETIGRNGITVKNLGVDSGLDVCNSLYAGVAKNGMMLTVNTAGTGDPIVYNAPITGIVVNDVICLAKDSTSAIHGCLIQGVDGAVIDKVKTCFGTHGFVLKGINCQVGTITTNDSSTDGVIIRDSPYGRCNTNNIKDILIKNTTPMGGLILDADESGMTLKQINIDNVIIQNCTFGVRYYSNVSDSYITGININNLIINTCTGLPIEFIGRCIRNNINNMFLFDCKDNGLLFSTDTQTTNINNSRIVGDSSGHTGVTLKGANNKISNLQLEGFANNWDFAGSGHMINNSTIDTYTGTATSVKVDNCDLSPILPTLLNSFVNTNAGNSQAKYFKENNVVNIEGMVSPLTLSTAIFTLPVGYRPLKNMRFICRTDTGLAWIAVNTAGSILIESVTGTTYVSLDGINFRI